MKKFNLKEKFLRIALATVTVGMLTGAVFSASLQTEAATENVGVKAADGKVLLADKLLEGGINDPVAVTNGSGTYYAPSDYIYYGTDSEGNPLLWRVLDADADNTGEEGAMFLFSEQIMDNYATFSSASDDTIYRYYSLIAGSYEEGSEHHFNSFWQSGRFEYTYQFSNIAQKQNALSSFIPQNVYPSYYTGSYLSSNWMNNLSADVYEMSALRPVTKTDALMGNGFGMNDEDNNMFWTVDTVYGENGVPYNGGNILNNSYIFALSVDELEKYVATYSGAPGLAASSSTGMVRDGWWLRTSYNTPLSVWKDSQTERKYIYAGIVDNNGSVTIEDVNSGNIGGRYGINLEKDRIVYGEMVDENVWRLGLIEPFYLNNPDKQFNAWIKDVRLVDSPVEGEDGKVLEYTVSYENAIGRTRNTDAFDEYVSVMIKDKNGNIKYYGTGDTVEYVDKYNDLVWYDDEVVFTLPLGVDFDERNGDKMLVFWERKCDDPNKTSFTSNMVEIECAHSDFQEPDCVTPSVCKICGESFSYPDSTNHKYTEWFAGTPDSPKHGYICKTQDCEKFEQIVFIEDCTVKSNCIEIFEACSCGNAYYDESTHVFVDPDDPDDVATGYCKKSNLHFQPADIGISGQYEVYNVGQFLWIGDQINRGNTFEGKRIEIYAKELDFSELEERGIKYFDFGSSFSKYHFAGTLDGNGVVIKNLTIDDSSYPGLFAYTFGATITDIVFENVKIIGGSYGGIVVSMAGETRIENIEVVSFDGSTTVDTMNGSDAALVGYAGDCVIENCIVYGVTSSGIYDSEKAGKYLPLIAYNYQNSSRIVNSFYLAEQANDQGGRTAEQMASGEVAVLLGSGWGQNLTGNNIDVCPRRGNKHARVHKVPACGGVGEAYSNNADGREAHTVTNFIEADGFTWDGTLCYVTMGCTKCDYTTTITLSPEDGNVNIVDHGGGVRYTFTAIVDAENGYFTNDIEIFAKRIEDVTVVEPIVKDFDGKDVYADDFMTNTKMNYLDAEASGYRDAIVYFVDSVTGEYVGSNIAKAGTYSLVVDGRRNYSGQKYVFKDVLTINKITLELEINALPISEVQKGEPEVIYSFVGNDEISLDWLIVKLSKLPSHNIGEYMLDVTVSTYRGGECWLPNPYYSDDPYTQDEYLWDDPYYEYDKYIESIELMYPESVKAAVLPQREVNIEIGNLWADNFVPADPDYYGDYDKYVFTYGENITDPTEANFTVDTGSKLSFEWYAKSYDNWETVLVRLPEKPEDAGEYVLRAVALATDNLVKNYIDIEFTIAPKILNVRFVIPEDAESIDYYGEKYYVFKLGEYPEFIIEGISEDEWEEYGISFEGWYRTEIDNYYRYYEGYPQVTGKYWIEVRFNAAIPFGSAVNYEINDDSVIYVYAAASETVIPLDSDYMYDGVAKDIELVIPEGWSESDYTVTITKNGETVSEIKDMGTYTVSVTDKNGVTNAATVTVRREIRAYVKERSIELSSDGYIPFNLMDLVFEAGYSPSIGHTLTDLEYKIDIKQGEILIVGWTVMAGDEDVSDLYVITSNIYAWRHEAGEKNVIHIYDNLCDGECNVCGLERAVKKHKGGIATCSVQAICEICGEYYGELNPENHENETEIFVPSALDLMKHDLVHACCGAIIRSESHSIETAATCLEQATCTVCRKDGYRFGPLDPNNHANGEFTYVANSADASKHDKYHACCGAFIETEDHSGGVADCVSGAICLYCSTEYGETDPQNHANPDAHSAADCRNRAKCSECGEYYGETDPTNHESSAIVKLPSVTDGNLHTIVHSCCGAIIGTESHTGGEATCNSLKKCSECGAEYGETDPANHASEDYAYFADSIDASRHVRARACCGADAVVSEHVCSKHSCLETPVCDECGVEYGTKGEHVYDNQCDNVCNVCGQPTRGMKFHYDENEDGKCDHCGIDVSEDDLGHEDDNIPDTPNEDNGETETSTETVADDGNKFGCSSSVGIGSFVAVVMTFAAGILLIKKKEY